MKQEYRLLEMEDFGGILSGKSSNLSDGSVNCMQLE